MRGGGNCCGEKSKLSPIAPPRISLEIVKDITYIQYHDRDLTTSSWSDISHDYHHVHRVASNLAKKIKCIQDHELSSIIIMDSGNNENTFKIIIYYDVSWMVEKKKHSVCAFSHPGFQAS